MALDVVLRDVIAVGAKDGGWIGSIHTLTIHAKVRLVPNDNRDSDNVPTFRVLVGRFRIGDAWSARSSGNSQKEDLRICLDDPCLSRPISTVSVR